MSKIRPSKNHCETWRRNTHVLPNLVHPQPRTRHQLRIIQPRKECRWIYDVEFKSNYFLYSQLTVLKRIVSQEETPMMTLITFSSYRKQRKMAACLEPKLWPCKPRRTVKSPLSFIVEKNITRSLIRITRPIKQGQPTMRLHMSSLQSASAINHLVPSLLAHEVAVNFRLKTYHLIQVNARLVKLQALIIK